MVNTTLCVDLDGTLIHNDTLCQLLGLLIKSQPWYLLFVPLWLLRGRAYVKQQLAKQVSLDVKALPYNDAFIGWLTAEKNQGRKIVLVTAMDKKIADAVADYIGIFAQVLASDGNINLRAQAKATALNQLYGIKNYDYAGNSRDDLVVWRSARYAIVVNAREAILRRAQKVGNVIKVF